MNFVEELKIDDKFLSNLIKNKYSKMGINSLEDFERYLKNNKLNYLDVKNTAMESYNNKLQKKLGETVWASNCGSWYKTEEGKIINNYPGYGTEYYFMMSRPNYNELNAE